MRGPVLFVLFLVAGATTGALLLRPQPAGDGGAGEDGHGAPAFFPAAFSRDREGPRRSTFASSETLGLTLTACAAPGACLAVVGQPARDVDLVRARDLAAIEVSVSWSPASAATERLTVSLLACGDEDCDGAPEPLAVATGESPLVLAFAAEDALDAEVVTLRVASEDRAPSIPGAYASPVPQPFDYAGAALFR